MWLFTKFGFFSVVRKDDFGPLTVRSRTRGDLDRLRNHYLPSLSASLHNQGSDYPWRAIVDAGELAKAMERIVLDISYANFKDEVAACIGKDRAKRYGKVWSALYDMPEDLPEPCPEGFDGLPWPQAPAKGKALAYGAVVVDVRGNLLLREVKNHFDGYVWTFAKGRPDKGESPRDTALREVREETGAAATIIAPIPGEFAGGTTINRFFLAVVDRDGVKLDFENRETAGLCWATPEEAVRLIGQTTNIKGRERDLAILQAAQGCLPAPLPLKRPLAHRSNGLKQPMPAKRVTLPLETRYSQGEMAAIHRGYVAYTMEEKWFLFYEDGVLHCHRSWTGYCIFRVYFRPTSTGWQAWQVEINRHPGQYQQTDDRENLRLLDELIEQLLIFGPQETSLDSFTQAVMEAAKSGYLGSPTVVSDLLLELFAACVGEANGDIQRGASLAVIHKLSGIFATDTEGYTRMPGWHTEGQLGKAIVQAMNLDADYFSDENLTCLLSEGLAAVKLKIGEMVQDFEADLHATWERDGLPQLNNLHNFVVSVFLGTNRLTFPNVTLDSFHWQAVTEG